MKTLIFDNSAGRLQWMSNREAFLEALKEFNAAVRIAPHNRGLNPADWKFCRVRDEKAGEIADWHKHGTAGAFGPRIWLQTFGRGRIHPPASLDLFSEDDGTAEATRWKSAA
jgi:hypothetical protein